jgi:hypothetical protein
MTGLKIAPRFSGFGARITLVEKSFQRPILDGGGMDLPEEGIGIGPRRMRCAGGIFSKLWYCQKNIRERTAATNTQLTTPFPRNTIEIQASMGRQIAVLEMEIHKECKNFPIFLRSYSQSAAVILIIPKMAATTCTVRISIMFKISSRIDAIGVDPAG